jgi:hypothetical protein
MLFQDEIQDPRKEIDFRGITFSGFKKDHVKKELLKNLLHSKMEPAFYWSVELICAGHFSDLWDVLLLFFGRHIHTGHPKLSLYLDLRAQQFKAIVSSHTKDTLSLRNEPNIRRLFAEIICLLCESKQKHGFDEIKIKGQTEFYMGGLSEKLQATHDKFATALTQASADRQASKDPQELFIAMNELAFHVSPESKNALQACYWMEWIMEFVKENKHLSHACFPRIFAPVQEPSKKKEVVWAIWEVLIQTAKVHHTPVTLKICESLLSLFALKYGTALSQFKKRKFLMYFAISLLTENESPLEKSESLVSDKERIAFFVNKVHLIYRQIKKNEVPLHLHSHEHHHSPKATKELSEKEKTIHKSLAKLKIIDQQLGV